MIIKVVREKTRASGAIPSKVYVDGVFFSYGLENEPYKIPNGQYSLYYKVSPTFKKNKVYIDVPNRSNVLIHGGNTIDDTKGCLLVGADRDGEFISKDQSDELFNVVEGAAKNGEGVAIVFDNDKTLLYAAICFLGLLFITLKGR